MQNKYRNSSRDFQRLESVLRTPVFTSFAENLAGASTLRALGLERQRLHLVLAKTDDNTRAAYLVQCIQLWLRVRLDNVAATCLLASALLAVLGARVHPYLDVPPGLVGVLLISGLNLVNYLNWSVM